MMRVKLLLAGIALALAGPAAAHVGLTEHEAAAGASYRTALVVGHGCDGAATTGLRVTIPQGLYNVQPQAKPGWEIRTVSAPYAQPFDNHGTVMTEGVSEIIWSGGSLPDDVFDEFGFRGTVGHEVAAGTKLFFRVIQSCGDAEAAWTDQSGDHGADWPAPHVEIRSGHGH